MRFLSFDVGFRNLAYCACSLKEASTQDGEPTPSVSIFDWEVVDVVAWSGSKAKTKNIGMERLCRILVKFLREHHDQWESALFAESADDADECTVIIEQQLARAQTMKMLQYTIFVYFQTAFPDVTVKFCHAKHKLQTDVAKFGVDESQFVMPEPKKRKTSAEPPSEKIKKQREKARSYKLNKDKGKWIAEQLLSKMTHDGPEWQSHFRKNKKKDDLADCLLQAVACYEK